MNDKKPQKFVQLLDLIKLHRNRIFIISAIIIAIILLIIFIPLMSKPSTKNVQSLVSYANAVTTESVIELPSSHETSTVTSIAESSVEQSSKTNTNSSKNANSSKSKNTSKSSKSSAASSKSKTTSSAKSKTNSVSVKSGSAQKTGYQPLDTLVSKILSNITYSGMSSNAKLNAIYNYVKNNMKYDMNPSAKDGVYEKLIDEGYSDYDSSQMTLAYNAALYHEGVCDNYAALTMVLARAAGIPLYQCGGLSSNGSSHTWNILIEDGKKYLVDTNYGIFMQRFSSSGFTEQMDGKNYFNNFSKKAPSVKEKKISWMFNAGFGSQRFMGNDRGKITQKAIIDRPMYADANAKYPEPITPMVQAEGKSNSFTATVSSNGKVIETLKKQSGKDQMYYFSWYPPKPGSYVIKITAKSDDIFTGSFIINAKITK